MSLIPIAPLSDDRRAKAMAPMVMRNMMWEKVPEGAPTPAKWCLKTFPSPVRRYLGDVANPCRGIYASPGVQDGALFAVLGQKLYRVSSAYALTYLGDVTGADWVKWGFMRDKLLVLGGGNLYQWDGAFTKVTDVDFPANAATLTTLDQRAIVTVYGEDQIYWSDPLDALSWGALSFATAEQNPDEIKDISAPASDLILLGAKGIELLAGGGDNTLPFQTIRSAMISKGCLCRSGACEVDGVLFFIGDDKVAYRLAGGSITPLPNRDLEDTLESMSETDLATIISFRYRLGSRIFWVVRVPDHGAYCFDVTLSEWSSELTTWDEETYKIAFTAQAYGKTFCAGPARGDIFTFEDNVYDDNGDPVERSFTLPVPIGQPETMDYFILDLHTYDVPISGQGSDPTAMVEYWKDGGYKSSASRGVVKEVKIQKAGKTTPRPKLKGLGMCTPQDGLIIRVSVTDPVGLRVYGARKDEIDA